MKHLKMKFVRDYKKQFGGDLLIGQRKSQRPLSTKKPIHLVIRTEAIKPFNPSNTSLKRLIDRVARKFQIRIYDLALNWNHIHALIMIKDRKNYVRFIRALNSLIAVKIRQHLKTAAPLHLKNLKNIFTLRPFTRILEWGKDFKNVKNYIFLNQIEAFGLVVRAKGQRTRFTRLQKKYI